MKNSTFSILEQVIYAGLALFALYLLYVIATNLLWFLLESLVYLFFLVVIVLFLAQRGVWQFFYNMLKGKSKL